MWRLAIVIVFGAFMSGLDTSVVALGLDTVAADLDSDLARTQWVANGYLLALAVSLPASAWVGRRIGVGRLWLIALTVFTVASGLCAAAGSIGWLIALRVIQGLAAGLLIPTGQTILGQAVGPDRLGRVMATLGIAVTLAPALGPSVGGLLLTIASWQWLFLINLPLGAIGLTLGCRYVPRGARADAGPLDVTGLVLLSSGLPLIVYALTAWTEGRTADPRSLALLGLGAALLLAFGAHARRVPRPVLNIRLFTDPLYAAAAATAAFTGAAMFGAGVLFPLYYQVGRGADVLDTGLLLISMSAGTALLLPCSGWLVDRYGGGVVALAGAVAMVVTTAPFALLPLDVEEPLLQALLLVRGMALALTAVPATVTAYRAVTVDRLPDATTQINILQRLGGALGGAVFAVVVASRLPDGPAPAFHAAFWHLVAASAAALLAAAWMTVVERRRAPVAPH
ncbi:multidrug efflux MFS transporter [Blastococcus sp. MG754426]|nr:multidrug efflux MFS transporter [Blastococcus sp. MG754426]MCF6513893.1 multidrug efflux MFS transporter [Blastococcus sp. MG754427]